MDQLTDDQTRAPVFNVDRVGNVAAVIMTLARVHGITAEPAVIDGLANAVSRLSDAEVELDHVERCWPSRGRASSMIASASPCTRPISANRSVNSSRATQTRTTRRGAGPFGGLKPILNPLREHRLAGEVWVGSQPTLAPPQTEAAARRT